MSRGAHCVHVLASRSTRFGGLPVAVVRMVERSAAAGVGSTLLAGPTADGETEVPVGSGVRTGVIPASGQPVLDHLTGSAASCVHVHGLWLPVHHAAAAAARRVKAPLVISPHGMLAPWALAHRKWKKRLAWWAYQRADLRAATVIHVTSPMEAREVRAAGLTNPLAVIPLGVDVPADLPCRSDPADGRRVALFLSRVHPKKGLLTLVAAWKAVRPVGWRVVIAGPDEGGHRADVERAVGEAGLTAEFEFVGELHGPAKWQAYRTADLFVLPSFSENFGLVIGEALAGETPVLTTTATPWEELPAAGCGWCVPPTLEAVTDALRDATSRAEPELREMGRRGRRLVRERYTWHRVGTELAALYRHLAAGGPAPDCLSRD